MCWVEGGWVVPCYSRCWCNQSRKTCRRQPAKAISRDGPTTDRSLLPARADAEAEQTVWFHLGSMWTCCWGQIDAIIGSNVTVQGSTFSQSGISWAGRAIVLAAESTPSLVHLFPWRSTAACNCLSNSFTDDFNSDLLKIFQVYRTPLQPTRHHHPENQSKG